jgi:tetratricopeptide (TPR) repeat protein
MKLKSHWVLILLLFIPHTCAGGERTWIEVKSPHFRVLTDAGAGDGRRVAREFERLRAVFAARFPEFRLESGAPLTIFAARDEETAKTLAPVLWKAKGAKPAGYFHHSWEKQFALVRMDTWNQGTERIVYHEYTHMITALNSRWLPVWLNEGMAEFYAYTRFEENKTLIGAPTERFRALRERPWIPIETLITVNQRSPYYHDEDKVQMFYAESWALVHYCLFGPNMGGGKKLDDYYQRMQKGTEQKQAFQEAFGSFKAMDQQLRDYLNDYAFHAAVVKVAPEVSDKEYQVRTLSMAETQAELGGYQLWTRDREDARVRVAEALKSDPKLGLAHEEQGFLELTDGKATEAASQFAEAVSDDKSLYLSQFAKTMMSPQATSDVRADQSIFLRGLTDTLNMNLQFAPAFIQMARLAVRQNDLNTALKYSMRAESLEPSRAGYHTMSGQILLRMRRGKEAAENAKFVADRWFGADHNEAVELWNSVPESERPAGEVVLDWNPKETQRAEGILKGATCGDNTKWSLSLAQEDQTLTFHSTGRYLWGYSDSLWFGHDHINFCHYLEGHRTIVYYKPAAEATHTGDVVEFEVRDDLPPAVAAETKP